MAIGDGSWLKKNFPKLYERRQQRKINKANKLAKNKNVALQKRSEELDEQISKAQDSQFRTDNISVRRLQDEKNIIDTRRKYDASESGTAQMKIDEFVKIRSDVRNKLAELKKSLSTVTNADRPAVENRIKQAENRLKSIQTNINDLWSVAKKHKTKKIVKKSTPMPKKDRDVTIYDDENGESRVPVTKVNEFDESYDY